MGPWPSKPIGDLCTLINGRAFKPSNWGKNGLPIVRIQNLNDPSKPFNKFAGDYLDKHFIDDGAILLSWSGTPGTSFGCFRWKRGPALLNQHIFKVLVLPDIMDGDFFILAVNSRLDEMIRQAHGGVGLRHITKSRLQAIELPVPPLPEQRRIVGRVEECMKRVEEMSVLRCEAVDATLQLESSLYAAVQDGQDWDRKSVGQLVVESKNGKSVRQSKDGATGGVLSLSAVRDVTLDLSQRKPIVLADSIAAKYAISSGDVFVSRSNTRNLVGLASVSTRDAERVIFPDLLIRLEPKLDMVRPRYLAYALRTTDSRRQIKERAVGTSQSRVKISGARLKQVEIPVPPLEVQDAIVHRSDELHDLASGLMSELVSLDCSALTQSILRKALSGGL